MQVIDSKCIFKPYKEFNLLDNEIYPKEERVPTVKPIGLLATLFAINPTGAPSKCRIEYVFHT